MEPNDTHSDTDSYEYHVTLFFEIFSVVAFFAIALNVLIAVAILKYEKLRRETSNIILLHFTIVETALFMITAVLIQLMIDLGGNKAEEIVFFLLLTSDVVLVFTIFLLIFLLIIDGYIKTHFEEKYKRFERSCKHIFAGIYTASVIFFINISFPYFTWNLVHLIINVLFLLSLLGALTLTLVILNLAHCIKSINARRQGRKPNVGLVIANIFLIVWLPFVCWFLSMNLIIVSPKSTIIFTAVGFTSPILNFIYLYAFNGEYHVFLNKLTSCRKSDQRNELVDEPVTFDPRNGTVGLLPT